TSSFTPLFLQGNAGNDTINLGTGAHNLDYLRSAVHVRAWGSTDRINLFDDAAGYDDTYTINASGVSRYIFGGLDYANSYGNAIAQVTLHAENGGNAINVDTTLAGCNFAVNAGGGQDTINVTDTATNSQVTILPSTGGDTV